MFEGTFIDLFDTDNASDHLMNFASDVVTTPAIEESLRKALEKGSHMATYFMKQRLIPSEDNMPLKSFYEHLPKSGIKTMTEMQKTVRIQSNSVTINGHDKKTLARLIVTSHSNVIYKTVYNTVNYCQKSNIDIVEHACPVFLRIMHLMNLHSH